LTCIFAAKLHSAEYLDSHIGEKRFADDRALLPLFARFGSPVTVLFFSAVTFLFPPRLSGSPEVEDLLPVRSPSCQVKETIRLEVSL
jgi:hypothetical protein